MWHQRSDCRFGSGKKGSLQALSLERRIDTCSHETPSSKWLRWFEEAVADRGNTAKERLLATFDVLQEWYASPEFRGCPFINAVLEIADASHPAHQVSVEVREAIRTHIRELAFDAGVGNPEAFSQQYLLLIGGASLMATIEEAPAGAEYARKTLSVLIDAS